MRLVLLAFLIGCYAPAAAAQFDLQPGDLAIVGFYSDDPDAIAVLALVDIAAGTEIAFTDRGWRAEGGFYDGPGDGTFRYTVPAPGHAAGEVFVLDEPPGIDLSTGGDQILIYTGPDDDPWFVYAFNFESEDWWGTWQDDATDAHTSALPPGLLYGYTAGAVEETDNAVMTLYSEGVRSFLLNALVGFNHERSDTVRLPFPESFVVLPDTTQDAPYLFSPLTRRKVVEGRPITSRYLGVDLNGDAITYALVEGPEGASVDPVRGLFTWTPPPGSAGTTPRLLVSATDDDGTRSRFTYLDVVSASVNHAPQLLYPAALSSDIAYEEFSSLGFGVSLYDPEGAEVSLRLVSAPEEGDAFLTSDGGIQWENRPSEIGMYEFVIEGSDGETTATYPVFVALGFREWMPLYDWEAPFPDLEGAGLRAAIRERFAPPTLLSGQDAPDALLGDLFGWQWDEVRTLFADYRAPFAAGADPSDALASRGVVAGSIWPGSSPSDAARRDLFGLFPMRADVRDAWDGRPFADIPDAAATAWYLRDLVRSSAPADSVDLWSEAAPGRFEPREAVKGSVARAVLYLATMYEDALDLSVLGPQLETLLEWDDAYPAGTYTDELYRAGLAQQRQGSVNPFLLDETLARRAFAELVSADPLPEPETLSLSAAVPNPATRAARLTLALPTAGHVRAEAFDLLGRRVQVLHDGPAPAGPLALRLDAAGLAPGVYVVRAATPAGTATQKVTVAR